MNRHEFTPSLEGSYGSDMLERRHLMSGATAEVSVAQQPPAVDYNAAHSVDDKVAEAKHLLASLGYSPETGEPMKVPVAPVQTDAGVSVAEQNFDRVVGEVTGNVATILVITTVSVLTLNRLLHGKPDHNQEAIEPSRVNEQDVQDPTVPLPSPKKPSGRHWWRAASF